jgi:carbamoyltransferase
MTEHPPAENAPTPSGWVVGLNHGGHDASAALLHNGELVVTVEQERLSRRKRALEQSPADALRFCLEYAGITLADVDVVALGSDHDRLARWLRLDEASRRRVLPYDDPDWLFPRQLFGDERPARVEPIEHHLAHAASAFWPSGFEEAVVLVFDAMGEDYATSVSVGGPQGLKIIETHAIDVSLGYYYETASEFTGLGRQDGGKLMGLAAYGRPRHPVALDFRAGEIVWDGVAAATRFGRDLVDERCAALADHFARGCYPYAPRRLDHIMAYADFAASAQAALERVIVGLAEAARERTALSRVALAGGVALNCTANGRLAASGLFEEIYVQPMAHDAGVALGAALVAARARGAELAGSRMRHAYYGPPTHDHEVVADLREAGLKAERLTPDAVPGRVAELVAAGAVVAWHQGRAEVGPRALGARSLIGDPRTRDTLVRLNRAKSREMWRPLAPSVQAERFGDFFTGLPNQFMIVAASVRPEVRSRIPAVVHVDGSARPHVVHRPDNPRYHDLLAAFDRLAGVPLVVNTSLNVAEQPMASTPRDSIDVYRRSDADALMLGDHLVVRS